MADNEQSANYETAARQLDETFNKGGTHDPETPVIRVHSVPDPLRPVPDPVTPAPAANPEAEPSGA
ncbi:hypothetical protein [Amycolatopsis saalfeldensis]|uniref:Uncharacterized protein n=1 Tax=Amycolatopsis saalfeldensis TaxID=394193 RepID=A0A1H8UJQ6_9PSEU|nr:hypothetical protein [Amycolatopsis saalfeldensis]SEP03247.1 hypothetical protein SAMN04489732_103313 [Amycolatopsis saalfeldensis]